MAIAGFTYILLVRKNFQREIKYAVVILIAGLLVYFVRSWKRREWPFGRSSAAPERVKADRIRHRFNPVRSSRHFVRPQAI